MSTSLKDCDVLRAALRLLATLPLTVTFEEVTGHLDEMVCYGLLFPMEKLMLTATGWQRPTWRLRSGHRGCL